MMNTMKELEAALERMDLIKKIIDIDNLLDDHMDLIGQEVEMIKDPLVEEEYRKTVDGAIELIAMHDMFYDRLCETYSGDEDDSTIRMITSLKEYRDLNYGLLVKYGVMINIVKFA